jgi:hypothetical protein
MAILAVLSRKPSLTSRSEHGSSGDGFCHFVRVQIVGRHFIISEEGLSVRDHSFGPSWISIPPGADNNLVVRKSSVQLQSGLI